MVKYSHPLPAGGAAFPIVSNAPVDLVDANGREIALHAHALLRDARSGERGEVFLLADEHHVRGDAIDQLRRERAIVQREQEIDLLIFGHGERIDLVARDVGVAVDRLVGKRDGLGVERRQRFGNFDGAPRDRGDRLGRQVDARGESPRAFGRRRAR